MLHAFEADAPGERQGFLGGIEDLQQVPCDSAGGIGADGARDLLHGTEEIRQQHQVGVTRQGLGRRNAGELARLARQGLGDPQQRGAARRRWMTVAGKRHALPGADQQRCQRQREKARPLALLGEGPGRSVVHGGGAVAPKPYRLRGLPFVFADEHLLGLRTLAPVDAVRRVPRLVEAVLPEGIAGTDAAAAVDPLHDGVGDALGRDQKGR